MNNQEDNIKISVITVSYNAESCIKATLQSVAKQDYSNIEYLVIDGLSKDNTLNLVKMITPMARIISEKDKGIYDAMNKGINYATGDYIIFMNAGDMFFNSSTLSEIVRQIKALTSLPDVVYGDTELMDKENKSLGLRRLRPPKQLTWRSFQEGMLVCHQSFIVRREIAPTYELKYKFSSDVDWCIRVLKKAQNTLFIDKVIARYLEEGTTTQNWKKSLWERFKVMCRHYGFLQTCLQHIKFVFIRQR